VILYRFLRKRFGVVLVVLALAHVTWMLAAPPGCLIIDEVTYHAMTRALARGRTLDLDNAYAIAPSPELEWEHARGVGTRLVAQYPPGYAVLVAPLYALLGARALFVVGVLSLFVAVYACHQLAFRVLGKRSLAIASAVALLCGSMLWEYGPSMWPHATTVALAILAMRYAFDGRWVTSGVCIGVATTMRLDAAFMLGAIAVAPALLAPPQTPARATLGRAARAVAGTLPAVAFLSLANHLKFGTLQPFSYGPWHPSGSNTGLVTYLPLAASGVLACVAVHIIAAKPLSGRVVVSILAASVVVLLVFAHRVFEGLAMIVVDLRIADETVTGAALTRGPHGAMMYMGAYKKAFVQSLPWLPFALAAPFLPRTAGPLRRKLLAVAAAMLTTIAVFGGLGWHGGLGLNLRYLLPAVPFAAILAIYTLYRLSASLRAVLARFPRIDVLFPGVAVVVVALVFGMHRAAPSVSQALLLDAPLGIAAIATTFLVLAFRFAKRRAASVALVVGIAGFAWAGLVEIAYDAPHAFMRRLHHLRVARAVREVIPPGSIVFANYPDIADDVLEDGDAIADPRRDGYEDLPRVVRAAAERGRPSFALVDARTERITDEAARRGGLVLDPPIARVADVTVRPIRVSRPRPEE